MLDYCRQGGALVQRRTAQPVREADLIRADGIPPVGSPVDGDDHDITGPLRRPRPAEDLIGGRVGQIGQQIEAGPVRGSGPARRNPAGARPAGEEHHAAAARHRDRRRPPGLIGVTPRRLPPAGRHRPRPPGCPPAPGGRNRARDCSPARTHRCGRVAAQVPPQFTCCPGPNPGRHRPVMTASQSRTVG